jgi:thiol-disulfide isomerase/thioredoxin
MKKFAALVIVTLTLTSCGTKSVATIESRDEVITHTDGTQETRTITTSPMPTKKAIVKEKGVVTSCRDVEFIDKPEEDVIINCLDGAQGFNIGAIKGPAIINVWGTWCAPCREEIPIFVAYDKIKSPEIQLVGIDVEDGPYLSVQPFIVANGMRYPIFYDPDRSTRSYFGMAVPVTWFIDKDNKVAYKKFGVVSSLEELQELAKKYLGVS